MNCIIILNYNNYKETLQYINDIKEFKCLDIIVIVDNASTDNSYSHLKKIRNDKIHIVKNSINRGYNFGNNSGIMYALEFFLVKKIIVSNPDIIVDETNMNTIFEDLNDYTLVAPLVYNNEEKIQSNCGWELPSYLQSLANCSLLTYKLQKVLGKSNYFSAIDYADNYVPVEAVSGCFFGLTADGYNQIGGFDEEVFLYGEEIILGTQLKRKSLKSIINKKCSVVHKDNGSSREDYGKWRWHSNLICESHIIYLKKYLKVNNLKIYFYMFTYNIGNYSNRLIDYIWLKTMK